MSHTPSQGHFRVAVRRACLLLVLAAAFVAVTLSLETQSAQASCDTYVVCRESSVDISPQIEADSNAPFGDCRVNPCSLPRTTGGWLPEVVGGFNNVLTVPVTLFPDYACSELGPYLDATITITGLGPGYYFSPLRTFSSRSLERGATLVDGRYPCEHTVQFAASNELGTHCILAVYSGYDASYPSHDGERRSQSPFYCYSVISPEIPDTVPPELDNWPGDQTENATGPEGAIVAWSDPTAFDWRSGNLPVHCGAPNPLIGAIYYSGAVFPVGTTVVPCIAIDDAANSSIWYLTVTVVDNEPPVFNLDGNEYVDHSGSWTPPLPDSADWFHDNVGVNSYDCDWHGAALPVGTTTINCWAYDESGNFTEGSFAITVEDTEDPVVTAGDLIVEATGPSGAKVTFPSSMASDNVGWTRFTCSPAAEPFAIGTTSVTCTAFDAAGNSGSATFNVTVVDTTPPVLTPPTDQTVEASGPFGAVVVYDDGTATDAVGVTSGPTCPGSATTFAIGTTSVTCTASDAAGNVGLASFDVTVVDTTAPVLSVAEVVAVSDGLYPSESFISFPATVGSPSVTLSGTATDVVGVSGVTVNGVDTTYAALTGNWSLSGITLAPGPNLLVIQAIDAAGNSSSASVTVVLDTDLDADGIANNVDGNCGGATAYKDPTNATFSDLQRGGGTCGTILRSGGHKPTITDSDDAAIGLHFEVEANPGPSVKIRLAGKASNIFLPAGTVANVTDPASTTTVTVVSGEATFEIEVAGVPAVIVIPGGASGTVTEMTNADGIVFSLDLDFEGDVTFNGKEIPTDGLSLLAPTNKGQCQDEGWKTFNFPRLFKNRGDCIQFVDTRK